jgi:predicted RNase H-like nuclease (RuvC/YqgF family)
VRDESVPPPGWVENRCQDDDYHRASGPEPTTSLSEAWAIYDAEHGYAPSVAALQERVRELELDRARVIELDGEARWELDDAREQLAAAWRCEKQAHGLYEEAAREADTLRRELAAARKRVEELGAIVQCLSFDFP